MEVLKTSETMENQIVDEARKKAAKVLQNAENECIKLETDLKKQFEKDTAQLETDFNRMYDKMAKDLAATLPLDLKRKKLAFIEKTIDKNLTDFFRSLKPAELIAIYKTWLAKVKDVFAGQSVRVRYNGLKADEVKNLTVSEIPKIKIAQLEQEDKADFTGLIMSNMDDKLKYRCTLEEVRKMLYEEFRKAMYDSLFREQSL